jgi:hypothetical protein
MTIAYTDGAFGTIAASDAPKLSKAFRHTSERYILRQTFWQTQAAKTELALNTAHATLTDFLLVDEGDETDEGNGIVSWERTYAKIPDDFTEPGGTYSYQFIGLAADFGEGIEPETGRERFTRTVMSVIEHEFFLVGSGGSYATAQEIPLIPVTEYVFELAPEMTTDYLVNQPPTTTPTLPTRDEYTDMIADDAADADSYSIVVECNVEAWMGNIWVRKTQRIKAL